MKKILLILITLLPMFSNAQFTSRFNSGIGTGGGLNTPLGIWGVFYNQRFLIKPMCFEVRSGVGIDENFVFQGGFGTRFFGRDRKVEILGYLDYSYHFSGEIDYEDNNIRDIYSTSQYSYLQPNLCLRGFIDVSVVLQARFGYSILLSEPIYTHKFGPDLNSNKVEKHINSGMMLELDLIIFFKP
jgi:hypothetical protein